MPSRALRGGMTGDDQTCREIAQAPFTTRRSYTGDRLSILIEVKGGHYCSRFDMFVEDGKPEPRTD